MLWIQTKDETTGSAFFRVDRIEAVDFTFTKTCVVGSSNKKDVRTWSVTVNVHPINCSHEEFAEYIVRSTRAEAEELGSELCEHLCRAISTFSPKDCGEYIYTGELFHMRAIPLLKKYSIVERKSPEGAKKGE